MEVAPLSPDSKSPLRIEDGAAKAGFETVIVNAKKDAITDEAAEFFTIFAFNKSININYI
jgi:5-formaminoimidazole-4-carboxamide-1-beta-D-ribofuranosyl 5'-monophosphate synthetase